MSYLELANKNHLISFLSMTEKEKEGLSQMRMPLFKDPMQLLPPMYHKENDEN